jgi:hypothetical protein
MSGLPPGFVLDQPSAPQASDFPPGFVLDQAPKAAKPVAAAMSVNNPPLPAPQPEVGPAPPQAPQQPPMPWGDVAMNALKNLPASAGDFAGSLYHAVTNPVETVKTVGQLAGGVISKTGRPGNLLRVGDPEPTPQEMERRAKDEGVTNAFGDLMASRYATDAARRNTMATDPVGVLADFSTVASGGAALPGRAGMIAGKIATATDPITQTGNALKLAGKGAETVTSNALGLTTGAGKESVRAAARAGREGGDSARAFTDSMRGNVPIEDVVNTAKAAVDQVRQDRAAAYKGGMADLSKDKTVLDFQPIDDALAKATDVGTFKGKVVNRSAGETMDKVSQIVTEWKGLDPKEFHTPEGLDALKRTLGDLRDSTEHGTPARVAADRVYNAVKGEIAKQAPDYAKTMEAYARASDNLKEVTKTLSLGEKATGDTAGRKLLSATRNEAQTNYGQRIKLIDQLAQHEPTLPYMIAGQGMNALAPRGLVGRGGMMAAGGSILANPLNAFLLPGFSPRLVGEAAYAGGKGAGLTGKALNALRITEENIRRTGRGAYQTGRLQEAQ